MRPHYAWVIVAVTFVAVLVSQAIRASTGLLIIPLEQEYGWDRASISLGIAFGLIVFAFGGPIGGALMNRYGPRRVLVAGIALISAGAWLLMRVQELWQFYAIWGLVIGVGTGATGGVISAAIAHRWFRKHQGIVVAIFGAAASAGQLIFLPLMANVMVADGWRAGITIGAVATALVLIPVALFMRDSPADVGIRPFGEEGTRAVGREIPERPTPLRVAVRARDFWLLAGSFFVCGFTSNGLVGTHFIPHAIEHGFTEVVAASAIALSGSLNIVGTLASGWLTDRYDPRKLLGAYYGFRAISLMALPLVYDERSLWLFAIVYGLDWIATVPPTVNLVVTRFGRASLGTLYGWILFSHMIGASLAAYSGGFFRELLGDYHLIFVSGAVLGFIAVALALRISPPKVVPEAVAQPLPA